MESVELPRLVYREKPTINVLQKPEVLESEHRSLTAIPAAAKRKASPLPDWLDD